MRSHLPVAGRGVGVGCRGNLQMRAYPVSVVGSPCPSAGSCWCACAASRTCAPILRLPGVGWCGAGVGTAMCGRISSTLRRYVFVCGFLSLRLSGIPDLRAYLRVAVRGGLCRCCGNRRLWVYFVGTVEMHAYLPVSAAVPVRLPGFTRLSPGSCVIGAVPSPGQTTPARAPSPASR